MGAIFVDGHEFGGVIASPATVHMLGLVKPDGTSIQIDADGTIHATGSAEGDYITRAEFDAYKESIQSEIEQLKQIIK